MLKNLLLFAGSISLAFAILVISIFRIAEIKYVFSQTPSPQPLPYKEQNLNITYNLPYPGNITPDNFLWPLKALRDRIWLAVTTNPSKKADLYLLLADKRLANAKDLFDKNNIDLGVSVLTKAEKYLELAHNEERLAHKDGMNTSSCLEKYILATLKHRQVINQILANAPEDAKPIIIQTEDYSKNLYNQARDGLLEAGAAVPPNPYD